MLLLKTNQNKENTRVIIYSFNLRKYIWLQSEGGLEKGVFSQFIGLVLWNAYECSLKFHSDKSGTFLFKSNSKGEGNLNTLTLM